MHDIHAHVIYGIDDGSPDLASTEALLELAAATGTRHLVATPHVIERTDHPSWEEVLARLAELEGIAKERQLDLKLYSGAEVMLSLDILSAYDEAPHAFCINNTKYALVELPMFQVPRYTEDAFYELQLRGLVPVLAHPERYVELFANKANQERLLDWCRKGVLLQCNGGSILGKVGPEAQKNLELLLHNKMISFIGSDAHRVKRRNTDLLEERKRLVELCGQSYADAICTYNPKTLLADEEVSVNLPKQLVEKEKPSFWKRIFG